MLLPMTEPMTTSTSLLIMEQAGLEFPRMSTVDMTISGKIRSKDEDGVEGA